jgi:hypothetical protein
VREEINFFSKKTLKKQVRSTKEAAMHVTLLEWVCVCRCFEQKNHETFLAFFATSWHTTALSMPLLDSQSNFRYFHNKKEARDSPARGYCPVHPAKQNSTFLVCYNFYKSTF